MICPDCGFDNIDGVDICEACAQPLVQFDASGSELEESISRHGVDVLSPKTPVTADKSTPVLSTIQKMLAHGIGCLLVLDGEELVGIVTERDILNKVSANLDLLDQPVGNFMTPSPATIKKQDSIAYALHSMDLGGYRHIPIVDDNGRPTGIISVRDILRFLGVRFAEIRSQSG